MTEEEERRHAKILADAELRARSEGRNHDARMLRLASTLFE
jgi:hypothetical protein